MRSGLSEEFLSDYKLATHGFPRFCPLGPLDEIRSALYATVGNNTASDFALDSRYALGWRTRFFSGAPDFLTQVLELIHENTKDLDGMYFDFVRRADGSFEVVVHLGDDIGIPISQFWERVANRVKGFLSHTGHSAVTIGLAFQLSGETFDPQVTTIEDLLRFEVALPKEVLPLALLADMGNNSALKLQLSNVLQTTFYSDIEGWDELLLGDAVDVVDGSALVREILQFGTLAAQAQLGDVSITSEDGRLLPLAKLSSAIVKALPDSQLLDIKANELRSMKNLKPTSILLKSWLVRDQIDLIDFDLRDSEGLGVSMKFGNFNTKDFIGKFLDFVFDIVTELGEASSAAVDRMQAQEEEEALRLAMEQEWGAMPPGAGEEDEDEYEGDGEYGSSDEDHPFDGSDFH